jgi:hypothetical protein
MVETLFMVGVLLFRNSLCPLDMANFYCNEVRFEQLLLIGLCLGTGLWYQNLCFFMKQVKYHY